MPKWSSYTHTPVTHLLRYLSVGMCNKAMVTNQELQTYVRDSKRKDPVAVAVAAAIQIGFDEPCP